MNDAAHFSFAILASIVAGGIIGFEREQRGRAAGFRTHILVCLASCLLMLAAARQAHWAWVSLPGTDIVSDPTRMAHGVLTGIGFLCAGVIFREGFSIHGLTTAASLWMASALGLLFGVELWGLAATGVLATIVVLALLRAVDGWIPQGTAVDLNLCYARDRALHENDLRELLKSYDFRLQRIAWRVSAEDHRIEHRLKVHGVTPLRTEELAAHLRSIDEILAFEISPRDD